MKDIINYYYDIKIDRLEIKNKCSIIESRGKTLIVKKIFNREKLEHIMPSLTNKFYKIILTKNNNFFFEYNNDTFIIFEVYEASKEKLSDFDILLVSEEAQDYEKVWQNNISYYMNYITSTGCEHKELLNDFNYYIGMAENAITIYNYSKKVPGISRQCISHYRIKYPNFYLFYYDPTELTIDYISRDIAEYIKSKFYTNGISLEETLYLIKKYQLNEKETCLLISRLIYPNFYFDFIKEDSQENKKITANITKKRKSYEQFLKNLINQLKTTNLSININWL